MLLSLTVAKKRVRPLLTLFNKKWYPHSQKPVYLDTFSLNSWNQLSLDRKNIHTLQQCVACHTQHRSLTRAFPGKKDKTMLKPVIEFNEHDLSLPANLGEKALTELNSICEETFNRPIQEVIAETPNSKLIIKPSSQERQAEMRKAVRQTKKVIQQSMDSTSTSTVMSNRISLIKYESPKLWKIPLNELQQEREQHQRKILPLLDRSESMVRTRIYRKQQRKSSLPRLALGMAIKI